MTALPWPRGQARRVTGAGEQPAVGIVAGPVQPHVSTANIRVRIPEGEKREARPSFARGRSNGLEEAGVDRVAIEDLTQARAPGARGAQSLQPIESTAP